MTFHLLVISSTGLSLTLAQDEDNPQAGEFYHVARSRLPAAGGVIKVIAKEKEDIRKLYATLHNQAVQVGQDIIHIQVINDLTELTVETGNDRRARA